MKKTMMIVLSVLCFPILAVADVPVAMQSTTSTGQARINELIKIKQEKMAALEKCNGTTKGLKIAGISTLGLTAVGVGVNIAEADAINKNTTKIDANKYQIEIDKKKITDKKAEIAAQEEAERKKAEAEAAAAYQAAMQDARKLKNVIRSDIATIQRSGKTPGSKAITHGYEVSQLNQSMRNNLSNAVRQFITNCNSLVGTNGITGVNLKSGDENSLLPAGSGTPLEEEKILDNLNSHEIAVCRITSCNTATHNEVKDSFGNITKCEIKEDPNKKVKETVSKQIEGVHSQSLIDLAGVDQSDCVVGIELLFDKNDIPDDFKPYYEEELHNLGNTKADRDGKTVGEYDGRHITCQNGQYVKDCDGANDLLPLFAHWNTKAHALEIICNYDESPCKDVSIENTEISTPISQEIDLDEIHCSNRVSSGFNDGKIPSEYEAYYKNELERIGNQVAECNGASTTDFLGVKLLCDKGQKYKECLHANVFLPTFVHWNTNLYAQEQECGKKSMLSREITIKCYK